MNLLLDTHVLLRAAGAPERLPAAARAMIEDPGTELVFSAASLWEVVIRNGLGRADFYTDGNPVTAPQVCSNVTRAHGETSLRSA